MCVPPDVYPLEAGQQLVCTVGRLEVVPGAINVIPGQVVYTLDLRANGDRLLTGAVAAARAQVALVCAQRGLTCGVTGLHHSPWVACDSEVTRKLS